MFLSVTVYACGYINEHLSLNRLQPSPLCLVTSLKYKHFISFGRVFSGILTRYQENGVHMARCHLERHLMKFSLMLDLGEKEL